MIRSIDRAAKDKALAELEEGEPANDFEQALTLIAELKVVLIADDGAQGGLNAESRALIRTADVWCSPLRLAIRPLYQRPRRLVFAMCWTSRFGSANSAYLSRSHIGPPRSILIWTEFRSCKYSRHGCK